MMGDRPSWATKDGTRPTRPAWGHFPAPQVLERPRAGRVDSVNIQKGTRAASVGADVRWENAHVPYTYIQYTRPPDCRPSSHPYAVGVPSCPSLLGRPGPRAPPRGSDPSGLSPPPGAPAPPAPPEGNRLATGGAALRPPRRTPGSGRAGVAASLRAARTRSPAARPAAVRAVAALTAQPARIFAGRRRESRLWGVSRWEGDFHPHWRIGTVAGVGRS